VPSSRTWDQVLSFASTTFVKLMREEQAMPGDQSRKVRDAIQQVGEKISSAKALRSLLGGLCSDLKRFVPVDSLGFETTRLTMLDIEKSQWLFSDHLGSSLPVAQRGSGYVSLLNLLLILQFVRNRISRGKNVILLLEEPELHLYPQVQ